MAAAVAQCGICLEENVEEVGELPGCIHVFCFTCITRWSGTENRCPTCRERFGVITRKRLAPEGGHDEDGQQGSIKRLKGQVLETVNVEDKKQQYRPDELLALDLDNLRCLICGTGEDEHQLMLCDGCDRGFHLYCVGLPSLPEEEWYCPDCEAQRALSQAARSRQRQRRARAGAGAGRSSRAASGGGAAPRRRLGRGSDDTTEDLILLDGLEDEDVLDDEGNWLDDSGDSGDSGADSAIVIDDSEDEAPLRQRQQEVLGRRQARGGASTGLRELRAGRRSGGPGQQGQGSGPVPRPPRAARSARQGINRSARVGQLAAAVSGALSGGAAPQARASRRRSLGEAVQQQQPAAAAAAAAAVARAAGRVPDSGGGPSAGLGGDRDSGGVLRSAATVPPLRRSAAAAAGPGLGSTHNPDQQAVAALRSSWQSIRAGEAGFNDVDGERNRRGGDGGRPGGRSRLALAVASGAAEVASAWDALEQAQALQLPGSSRPSQAPAPPAQQQPGSARERAALAAQRQGPRHSCASSGCAVPPPPQPRGAAPPPPPSRQPETQPPNPFVRYQHGPLESRPASQSQPQERSRPRANPAKREVWMPEIIREVRLPEAAAPAPGPPAAPRPAAPQAPAPPAAAGPAAASAGAGEKGAAQGAGAEAQTAWGPSAPARNQGERLSSGQFGSSLDGGPWPGQCAQPSEAPWVQAAAESSRYAPAAQPSEAPWVPAAAESSRYAPAAQPSEAPWVQAAAESLHFPSADAGYAGGPARRNIPAYVRGGELPRRQAPGSALGLHPAAVYAQPTQIHRDAIAGAQYCAASSGRYVEESVGRLGSQPGTLWLANATEAGAGSSLAAMQEHGFGSGGHQRCMDQPPDGGGGGGGAAAVAAGSGAGAQPQQRQWQEQPASWGPYSQQQQQQQQRQQQQQVDQQPTCASTRFTASSQGSLLQQQQQQQLRSLLQQQYQQQQQPRPLSVDTPHAQLPQAQEGVLVLDSELNSPAWQRHQQQPGEGEAGGLGPWQRQGELTGHQRPQQLEFSPVAQQQGQWLGSKDQQQQQQQSDGQYWERYPPQQQQQQDEDSQYWGGYPQQQQQQQQNAENHLALPHPSLAHAPALAAAPYACHPAVSPPAPTPRGGAAVGDVILGTPYSDPPRGPHVAAAPWDPACPSGPAPAAAPGGPAGSRGFGAYALQPAQPSGPCLSSPPAASSLGYVTHLPAAWATSSDGNGTAGCFSDPHVGGSQPADSQEQSQDHGRSERQERTHHHQQHKEVYREAWQAFKSFANEQVSLHLKPLIRDLDGDTKETLVKEARRVLYEMLRDGLVSREALEVTPSLAWQAWRATLQKHDLSHLLPDSPSMAEAEDLSPPAAAGWGA